MDKTDNDLSRYSQFVEQVTSKESQNWKAFSQRCEQLEDSKLCNIPLLMTSAIGLSSEAGEFNEIVKKMVFQGKPLDADVVFHMKRELGDILWYWTNACRSLHLDPMDVLRENVTKLKARYPDGTFDAFFSENRKGGDL
jgi:NTP pyrophosphatase (non-canonical NTP hydrolase)